MCDSECSLESLFTSEKNKAVNEKNNNTIQTNNISKVPIEQKYANGQNNDKSHTKEIEITICLKCCPSVPCVTEILENEFSGWDKAIAVQKSTSAPIKLEYVECQNYEEDEKDIVNMQPKPTLDDPKCGKQKKKYDEETDIDIKTNSSHYIITKDPLQNELQNVEYQNNNEEKIAVEIGSIPTDPKCKKNQNANEVEKSNKNIIKKQNLKSENNKHKEETKAVQASPVPIDSLCTIKQIKYETKNETVTQTKYMQYRRISKEQIEYKPYVKSQNNNEEKKNSVQIGTAPQCLNKQIKHVTDKENTVQTKYMQYTDVSKEQIDEPDVKNQINIKTEEAIAIQLSSTLNTLECTKKQSNTEENIGVQTKYLQYENTSKEPEQKYTKNQSNHDKTHKNKIFKTICPKYCSSTSCVAETLENKSSEWEDAIILQKTTSLPIKLKYVECQNYNIEDKDIGVQTNSIPSVTIIHGQKQTKHENVEYQNNNEVKQEIAIQPNPALNNSECEKRQKQTEETDISVQTDPSYYIITEELIQCVKWQNNNDVENETAVKAGPDSKYINRNIYKEQIEIKPHVKSQNNKNRKKEIDAQPSPTQTGSEYPKGQKKYGKEKPTAVKKSTSTLMKPKCVARKYHSEEEKNISVQKKPAQYIPITKGQKQTTPEHVKYQNIKKDKEENAFEPNPALTEPKCLKRQEQINEETNIVVPINSSHYKVIKDQKQKKPPCVEYRNDNEEKEKKAVNTSPAPTNQKYINKNISKEHIKFEPYVKIQSNKKEKKEISIQPKPALTGPECPKSQTKYEKEKQTAAQKSTSAQIKSKSVTRKYQNEREKNIAVQKKPTQYVPITKGQKKTKPEYVEYQNNKKDEQENEIKPNSALTEPKCCKIQNKINEETDIVDPINSSQYEIIKKQKQSKPTYLESRNKNEKENVITVNTGPTPTDPEYINKNISKEQNELETYIRSQNIRDEKKEIDVQPSSTITGTERPENQKKCEREKQTSAQKSTSTLVKPECGACKFYNEEGNNISVQKNLAQYVPVTKDPKETKPAYEENLNNKKDEQENEINLNSALTEQKCVRIQNKINEETDIVVPINSQYEIIKDQKQSKLPFVECRNKNEEENVIAVNTGSISTDPEYINKNISKEQIEFQPYVRSQNNKDGKKEIDIQPCPILTGTKCPKAEKKYERGKKIALRKSTSKIIKPECVACKFKNEGEKNIGAQRNPAQYVPITKEPKETKLEYVKYQNNIKDKDESAIEPYPALTKQKCVQRPTKIDDETDIVVQRNPSNFVINKGQNKSESPCVECGNNNEKDEKNIVKIDPAPIDSKYTYINISKKEIVSDPYVRSQNNIQPSPALIGAECMKKQYKNEEEKNISIQSKYIQYRNISKERINEPYFISQINNNKEKENAIQPSAALSGPEYMKKQNKNEEKKNIGVQPKHIQYKNIFEEQREYKPYVKSQNNNEEETKNVVQSSPAPTSPGCFKHQIKYEREQETAAQSKYMQYRNVPYIKIQNSNDKETVFPPSPALTGPECRKRQNKNEEEKTIGSQSKYIQYKNISEEQKEYKPFIRNQNSNDKYKEIIFPPSPTLTGPECMKRQKKNDGQKTVGAQSKYIQYKNISEEQREYKPFIKNQNSNDKYKEIVFPPNATLIGPECMKRQNKNDGEKNVGAQSKYVKYRNISEEQREYKNQNDNNEEASVQSSSAPTGPECFKKQIKYEREKETTAQTKYIQYRNISKERIDEQYVKSQNNNNNAREKEIAFQPFPAVNDLECIKKKSKIEEEKNIGVQGKYKQYKNIGVAETLENKSGACKKPIPVQKSISEPIKLECVECQSYSEEEKYIDLRTNPDHHAISKDQTEIDLQCAECQNNYEKEDEIADKKGISPIDSKFMKGLKKNEKEQETVAQTKYIKYRDISKEQIESEPYVKSQNYGGKEEITDNTCSAKYKYVTMGQKQIEEGCVNCENNYQGDEEITNKTSSASIKSQNVQIQKSNKERSNIATQDQGQYRKICNLRQKEQMQTETENVINKIKHKYYANQDNIDSRNEEPTSKKCEAIIENNSFGSIEYFVNDPDEPENNIAVQSKYIQCKKPTKEEIENKVNYEVTLQRIDKPIEKEKKTLCFGNIDNEQKDIHETNNTLDYTCNKFSNYVASKDFSKPENFKHLFTRKNYSQYIKKEESISSTQHGCSKKCSGYMTTVDYSKPERFTHLISTTKFCNSENTKIIKSSDDYSKIDCISQNLKRTDSKKFLEGCTLVVRKNKKSDSDDEYLTIKQRKSKKVIDDNNTSTIYRCAKKCIETKTILKNFVCTKTKPQKLKVREKNSTTSIFDMLKNRCLKN